MIPAKTSDVVSVLPHVLGIWLEHSWAWWWRTEDNWCWIEEPYFLLWQLVIFVTWWLSWTQSKYSNWSPLLPGWVSRWWNTDVNILEHTQVGSVWLLLLFEMMLCFGCGPKLWSATWHLLSSMKLSPFRHDSFGKILVRLSLACLQSVIFVWIQWLVFVYFFKRFLADVHEEQWVPRTMPMKKGNPI